MLNHIVLVGRLADIKTEENKSYITLSVSKPHKNAEGVYEVDLIPCVLNGYIANATKENCKKDDILAIKGSLENKENRLYVKAEKVTFLSSKTDNKEVEEIN